MTGCDGTSRWKSLWLQSKVGNAGRGVRESRYFYVRLLDVQTHVLQVLEHQTTTELIPRFESSPAKLVHELQELINHLGEAASKLGRLQEQLGMLGSEALRDVTARDERLAALEARLDTINQSLIAGFRLAGRHGEV